MVCSYEEIIGPSCLLHRGKSTLSNMPSTGFCFSLSRTRFQTPLSPLSCGPGLSSACCPASAEKKIICPVVAKIGVKPRPPILRPLPLHGVSRQVSTMSNVNLVRFSGHSSMGKENSCGCSTSALWRIRHCPSPRCVSERRFANTALEPMSEAANSPHHMEPTSMFTTMDR